MNSRRNKLFDISQARGPRRGPDVGGPADAQEAEPAAISVSVLVRQVKAALARAFPERVTVVGELSNVSRPASGHVYFSLKDANATLPAAMWKSHASRLKFVPTDGMEVIVEGKLDVYDAQGKLQLYAERMTPKGAGALELAFRQLKEKLQAEGLFDPAAKKRIPRFPRAIGVITSATGAAIRDIQRTLRRRWPAAKVYLLPAIVQGEGAGAKIAEALTLLDANAQRLGIETIIVGRGGGSLEDLWAFNEEPLARAIYAARTPIISGVGHEVDFTICDLVADLRAATPTAAAEHAVPDGEEMARHIANLSERLSRRVREKLATAEVQLASLQRSVVFRDPAGALRSKTQRLDELHARLSGAQTARLAEANRQLAPLAHKLAALHPARLNERAKARLELLTNRLQWVLGGRSKLAGDALARIATRLERLHPAHRLKLARQELSAAERQLSAMSYRSVLQRGFSVTRGPDGSLRRSAADFAPGEIIETELADGKIHSQVQGENDDAPAQAPTEKPKPKRKPKQKRPQQPDQPGLFD